MKRFFNLVLGAMAMVAVALISAFVTMRLAIHGREIKVPDLTHMSVADASRRAASLGLRLRLENKFYSPDTPAGKVLAQFPAPGTVVRRDWPVRITESLGTQQVSIPDLTGQGERSAAIHLRQLGLELGTIGHIASTATAGTIVAQTPPANSTGVVSPRVSVLLANEPDEEEAPAYVMPSLVGLSLPSAYARVAPIGLRIVSVEDVTPTSAVPSANPAGNSPSTPTTPGVSAAPPPSLLSSGAVVSQSPLAGHRVTKDDVVRISMTH